jgi:hypothetical protein
MSRLPLPPLFKKPGGNIVSSFRQEGSGYVQANFQAKKSYIIIPGLVFMEG